MPAKTANARQGFEIAPEKQTAPSPCDFDDFFLWQRAVSELATAEVHPKEAIDKNKICEYFVLSSLYMCLYVVHI